MTGGSTRRAAAKAAAPPMLPKLPRPDADSPDTKRQKNRERMRMFRAKKALEQAAIVAAQTLAILAQDGNKFSSSVC